MLLESYLLISHDETYETKVHSSRTQAAVLFMNEHWADVQQ